MTKVAGHVQHVDVRAPVFDASRKDAPGAETKLLEQLDRRHVRDAHVQPEDLDLAALGFREKPLDDRRSETVTLHLLRRDELVVLDVDLAGVPDGKWKLTRVEEPTDQQKATYAAWLGQAWPGKEKESAEAEGAKTSE